MLRTGTSTTSVVLKRSLRPDRRRLRDFFEAADPAELPLLEADRERRTDFFFLATLPAELRFLVVPLRAPFLLRLDELANLPPFTVFVRPACGPCSWSDPDWPTA